MIDDPELNLQQFIQACDGYQWNYKDQYCYRFPIEKYTWLKANQFCHLIGVTWPMYTVRQRMIT